MSIRLSKAITDQYASYLRTHFYFADRGLGGSFESALKNTLISNGPFIEAVPDFERGACPSAVVAEGSSIQSDAGLLRVLDALTPHLYAHQEAAVRRVLADRNVVVATGTGSGKTEAFLYPILAHLYGEHQGNKLGPGVRALILYPMNALANDQRERLGGLCRRIEAADPAFRPTFGQYIGETPENERDNQRDAQTILREQLPGELVFRQQMRESPPHILLTNYSMLEYLLLRPDDSPLFDAGAATSWRFIVLDEAHQYRGAKGIEMAMLLRRLKRRLGEGGCPLNGSLRCIATSATLAGEPNEQEHVARFGSALFDEPFEAEDVILARRTKAVTRIAAEDKHTQIVLEMLADGPKKARDVADRIFPDATPDQQVEALDELFGHLCQQASKIDAVASLRPRYHLFLRVLEGAFIRFWPEHEILLVRAPAEEQDGKGAAFELALCRECGQHYFVARPPIKPGRLLEPVRDPDDAHFGVAYLRPIEGAANEEDEAHLKQLWSLCRRCGQIDRSEPTCGHGMSIQVLEEEQPKNDRRQDELSQCGACGYGASGRDPVREVIHGAYGPNAVIATTLVRKAHPDRRKVLAFGDGRQGAAFFAWYLDDSYQDILNRNLLLHAASYPPALDQAGLTPRELGSV